MSLKYNPLTQRFDLDGDSVNFSFNDITEDVAILVNQQMSVVGRVRVGQKLSILGQLVVTGKLDQSIKSVILEHQQARVERTGQQMIDRVSCRGSIKVLGGLKVGRVVSDDMAPYFISQSEQFRINQNRQVFLFGGLAIQGNLKLKGKLKIK